MKRLLQIYVYGQWHIALCAAVFYVGGCKILEIDPNHWTGVHVFSATLFVYLLHRIYSRRKMSDTSFQRYSFLTENINHAQLTTSIAGLVGLITFLFLPFQTQVALDGAGLISIGYILPLIFRKRLRDIGTLKIFFIGLVWSVIPILSAVGITPSWTLLLLALENFLFIFALTIPFDVRDEQLDMRAKISNLTTSFKQKQLKIIMTLLIIAALTIFIFLFGILQLNYPILIGMIVLYSVQFAGTIQLDKDHNELYYLLFLDGLILFKGLLFILLARM